MEWRNRRKLSLSEEEEEVLFGMFGKSDLCEAGSFSLPKNRRTYPREFFEPFTWGIGLTGLLSKSWKERESGGRRESFCSTRHKKYDDESFDKSAFQSTVYKMGIVLLLSSPVHFFERVSWPFNIVDDPLCLQIPASSLTLSKVAVVPISSYNPTCDFPKSLVLPPSSVLPVSKFPPIRVQNDGKLSRLTSPSPSDLCDS